MFESFDDVQEEYRDLGVSRRNTKLEPRPVKATRRRTARSKAPQAPGSIRQRRNKRWTW